MTTRSVFRRSCVGCIIRKSQLRCIFFFFKQKTAYELIWCWSSDVCSSDLRDDYSLEALWGVVVFTVALRHASFESCLAELHRNASLCRLLGIPTIDDIPRPWNVSRFRSEERRVGKECRSRGESHDARRRYR